MSIRMCGHTAYVAPTTSFPIPIINSFNPLDKLHKDICYPPSPLPDEETEGQRREIDIHWHLLYVGREPGYFTEIGLTCPQICKGHLGNSIHR